MRRCPLSVSPLKWIHSTNVFFEIHHPNGGYLAFFSRGLRERLSVSPSGKPCFNHLRRLGAVRRPTARQRRTPAECRHYSLAQESFLDVAGYGLHALDDRPI